jgi:hypothetical protein
MEYIILVLLGVAGGFLFSARRDKKSEKESKEFDEALERELNALDKMFLEEQAKIRALEEEKKKEVSSEKVSDFFNDRNKH